MRILSKKHLLWLPAAVVLTSSVIGSSLVDAFTFVSPSTRRQQGLYSSFTRHHSTVPRESWSLLRAHKSNDDDDDGPDGRRYHDALALNKARTDVKNFLTQRAIQSFIFLLISMRDPHTVRWFENNYELKNLENFHGTGAFNLTLYSEWDSMLLDMLEKPPAVVVVRVQSRGQGKRGKQAKKNPYLKEKPIEFEIDIEPVSLVSRIISVRDQIANEWVKDLDTMAMANDMILDSYHEHAMAARAAEEEDNNNKERTSDDPTPVLLAMAEDMEEEKAETSASIEAKDDKETETLAPTTKEEEEDQKTEALGTSQKVQAAAKEDEDSKKTEKPAPTKVEAKDDDESNKPVTAKAADGKAKAPAVQAKITDEKPEKSAAIKATAKGDDDTETEASAPIKATVMGDKAKKLASTKTRAKGKEEKAKKPAPVKLEAKATDEKAEKSAPPEVKAEDTDDNAEKSVPTNVEAKGKDEKAEKSVPTNVDTKVKDEKADMSAPVKVEAKGKDEEAETSVPTKVEAKDDGGEQAEAQTLIEATAKGDDDDKADTPVPITVEAKNDDDYESKKLVSTKVEAKIEDGKTEAKNDDDDDDINVADLTAPYSDAASSRELTFPDKQEGRKVAFERMGMMMLNNAMVAPSPLRKGNFDLLCLLATQESIHRVLREYREAGDEREVSFEWLREFYTSRVSSHFDGNQSYGRGDDFLEELLTSPPTMKELEGTKAGKTQIGFIDPLRVAEDIIRMRSIVANDWKETMSTVAGDHMALRRQVLIKQMGNAVNPSPFDDVEVNEVVNESPKKQIFYEDGFQ